jgi:Malonyl-CoA decarboxylase C-terminal domain/Malonyl-CoA decarboxylase N-terminal domain
MPLGSLSTARRDLPIPSDHSSTGLCWHYAAALCAEHHAGDTIGFLGLDGLFAPHVTGNLVTLAAKFVAGEPGTTGFVIGCAIGAASEHVLGLQSLLVPIGFAFLALCWASPPLCQVPVGEHASGGEVTPTTQSSNRSTNATMSPLDRAKLLASTLLSERGEASGALLARELHGVLQALDTGERHGFQRYLATEFQPDIATLRIAAERYLADRTAEAAALAQAADPPRQELLRRINMAPGGSGTLIAMRSEISAHSRHEPELKLLDADLKHLFASWFNRGILELRRIDWPSPAAVLEKLIASEAVHDIKGWHDLQRRLAPDRRSFAFFHPALPGEPLIFVEVALVERLATSMPPLLSQGVREDTARAQAAGADTAIFYSLQLSGRPARRLARQLPDQAGGRRAAGRISAAQAVLHAVAGAGLPPLAYATACRGRQPRCFAPAETCARRLVARSRAKRTAARSRDALACDPESKGMVPALQADESRHWFLGHAGRVMQRPSPTAANCSVPLVSTRQRGATSRLPHRGDLMQRASC